MHSGSADEHLDCDLLRKRVAPADSGRILDAVVRNPHAGAEQSGAGNPPMSIAAWESWSTSTSDPKVCPVLTDSSAAIEKLLFFVYVAQGGFSIHPYSDAGTGSDVY
jgi:hypothetical protein